MHGTTLWFCCHSYKKKSSKHWRAKSFCCGGKYRKNDAHRQKIWLGQINKRGDKRHRRVAHTQKHVRRWASRRLLQHLEPSELEQQLLGTRMLEVHRRLSVLTITLQSEYGTNTKTLVLNGAPLLQTRGIRIR